MGKQKPSKATLEGIERIAKKIKDSWSLCELFAGTKRAYEAETMVVQTFLAAIQNQKKHGEPFSFRGKGVHSTSGGGIVDNATAYNMLLDRGYFVEESHKGKVVIFITQGLIDFVDGYHKAKGL